MVEGIFSNLWWNSFAVVLLCACLIKWSMFHLHQNRLKAIKWVKHKIVLEFIHRQLNWLIFYLSITRIRKLECYGNTYKLAIRNCLPITSICKISQCSCFFLWDLITLYDYEKNHKNKKKRKNEFEFLSFCFLW